MPPYLQPTLADEKIPFCFKEEELQNPGFCGEMSL